MKMLLVLIVMCVSWVVEAHAQQQHLLSKFRATPTVVRTEVARQADKTARAGVKLVYQLDGNPTYQMASMMPIGPGGALQAVTKLERVSQLGHVMIAERAAVRTLIQACSGAHCKDAAVKVWSAGQTTTPNVLARLVGRKPLAAAAASAQCSNCGSVATAIATTSTHPLLQNVPLVGTRSFGPPPARGLFANNVPLRSADLERAFKVSAEVIPSPAVTYPRAAAGWWSRAR